MVRNPIRFRSHKPSERVRRTLSTLNAPTRTALVTGLNDALSEEEIGVMCGGTGAILEVVKLDGGREALVEFTEDSGILLAVERIKIAAITKGLTPRIEEAWRRIDPDYVPVKDLVAKRGEEHSSSSKKYDDRRDYHRGSHTGSRRRSARSMSRSRSRSRSRSKSHSHHSRGRDDYDRRHFPSHQSHRR